MQMQKDHLSNELMLVDEWNHRGQPTKHYLNNRADMRTEISYYPSTGQIKQILNYSADHGDENNPSEGLEQLDYAYDVWGNIAKQELLRFNNATIDSITDMASETFLYDKLHRLRNVESSGVNDKSYQYDKLGNILKKSDFSDNYHYDELAANTCNADFDNFHPGPNAVTRAELIEDKGQISYHYDRRGNRVLDCLGGMRHGSYVYDYNNLMIESYSNINSQTQYLQFNYGADNQRYRKYDLFNKEITLYGNKDYEQIYDTITGVKTQDKYYVTSYMTITKNAQGNTKVHFMQKDRLGSTTQILDPEGNVLHTKSYDAFGKPRNGDWSEMGSDNDHLFKAELDFNDQNGTVDITKRGFTDHEHLDNMQLIHMNGRMYDYNNGRFLSVDPFIQAPTSTQSLNPYTYIFNNPLSGIDPSGYISCSVTGSENSCVKNLEEGDNTVTDGEGNELGVITKDKDGNLSFTVTTAKGFHFVNDNGIEIQGINEGVDFEGGIESLGQNLKENYDATQGLRGGIVTIDRNVDLLGDLEEGYKALGPGGGALDCATRDCSAIEKALAAVDFIPGIGKVIAKAGGIFLVPIFKKFDDVNLSKKLASEEQVSNLRNGEGKILAGANSPRQLRDRHRLAETYGGYPEDWAKITSSNKKHADGFRLETHAYKNVKTGEVVEFKSKIEGH